jgi:hypothetical protein
LTANLLHETGYTAAIGSLYCKKGWVSGLSKSAAPGQSLWQKTFYLLMLMGTKWRKGFFILTHIAVFVN